MARTIYNHTTAALKKFVTDPDPEYPVRAEVRLYKSVFGKPPAPGRSMWDKEK